MLKEIVLPLLCWPLYPCHETHRIVEKTQGKCRLGSRRIRVQRSSSGRQNPDWKELWSSFKLEQKVCRSEHCLQSKWTQDESWRHTCKTDSSGSCISMRKSLCRSCPFRGGMYCRGNQLHKGSSWSDWNGRHQPFISEKSGKTAWSASLNQIEWSDFYMKAWARSTKRSKVEHYATVLEVIKRYPEGARITRMSMVS